MDIAGLLDDVKERIRTRGATPLVGGGLVGAFTRGLLGLDPEEDSTETQFRAYQTGQALSNTPTPLALAAAPAAIVKAGKAAKATKPLPREAALETARKNAVEMLGLPESNTAMDRARALGYPMDLYESRHRPISRVSVNPATNVPLKKAEIIKAELEQMGIPVAGEQAKSGSTYLTIPGNPYKLSEAYGGGTSVPKEQVRFSTHSKRLFDRIPMNEPSDQFIADVFPKFGHTTDQARQAISDMIAKGGIRSRFAAFDPARINEKDLLASLAALGITVPFTMGLLSDQQE